MCVLSPICSLDVKILHLTRDPRPILLSRIDQSWCQIYGPVCTDPVLVCAGLVKDYHEARKLIQDYPTRFK